jgi:hypothetical protein
MTRIFIIVVLLGCVYALSYALAYTLRERTGRGFQYPPAGRLDTVLFPFFKPIYTLHGVLDRQRERHERDRNFTS